jgi:hypothetical protein
MGKETYVLIRHCQKLSNMSYITVITVQSVSPHRSCMHDFARFKVDMLPYDRLITVP